MSRQEFLPQAIEDAEKKLEPLRDKKGEKKMRKALANYKKEVEEGIPQYIEEERQRIKKLPPEINRRLMKTKLNF